MERPIRCPECPFGGKTIGGKGREDAKICFVGEAPSLLEIKGGKVSEDSIGEVLRKTFTGLDFDNEVYLANALACSARKKTPARLTCATRNCRERLLKDINAFPRKLIITLGNAALWGLSGDTSLKVTQIRGELLKFEDVNAPVLPLVHPSALMRGTGSYRQFRLDGQYALDLFHGRFRSPLIPCKHEVLDTPEKIHKMSEQLLRAGDVVLAADVETSGLNKFQDDLLSLGISWEPEMVYIIPEHLCTGELLNPIASSKSIKWAFHNGKFDIGFLRRKGIKVNVDHDTMLMSYVNDEHNGVHSLEAVAGDLLRAPNYKNMLKPYLPNKATSYAVIPKDILYEYQAKDVTLTLQIYNVLKYQIEHDKRNSTLYYKTLLPASEMLFNVERVGMVVDIEALKSNGTSLKKKLKELHREFEFLVGREVNLNSPTQLVVLLFDVLKIKTRFRDTTESTLQLLESRHACIPILLQYRKASKLYGTFVKGLVKHLDKDNVIHSTYNLHGTTTGRLSSRGPNLQNIPRASICRNQFIPPPGHIFLEVDLSQAELRSLAALSGDEALCEVYNSTDRSLHTEVAEKLFGSDYTHDEYVRAKAVNFGIIYGRQAKSLAEEYNISLGEGLRMIETWFETFPVAYEFILKCRGACLKGLTMSTVFGRRKRYELVTRQNLRNLQNEGANYPHQSLASDITLYSALRLTLEDHINRTDIQLQDMGCALVNLVHDALLITVPDEKSIIDKASTVVVNCMENTAPLWGITRVPFKADIKTGYKWGTLNVRTE